MANWQLIPRYFIVWSSPSFLTVLWMYTVCLEQTNKQTNKHPKQTHHHTNKQTKQNTSTNKQTSQQTTKYTPKNTHTHKQIILLLDLQLQDSSWQSHPDICTRCWAGFFYFIFFFGGGGEHFLHRILKVYFVIYSLTPSIFSKKSWDFYRPLGLYFLQIWQINLQIV